MRQRTGESAEKLNGAYYTPSTISDFLTEWGLGLEKKSLDILEPSCGDGEFVRSINRINPLLLNRKVVFTGIELNESEAQIAREIKCDYESKVLGEDFFQFVKSYTKSVQSGEFDLILGNPPYIRYQYFEHGKKEAELQFKELGIKTTKLANAWLYFLGTCVSLMKTHSRIGFVIPAELLHINYAAGLRRWLIEQLDKIVIVTFRELVFPNVQQEVILFLGEKNPNLDEKSLHIEQLNKLNDLNQGIWDTPKSKSPSKISLLGKWNKYYLDNEDITLFESVRNSSEVQIFDQIADVGIGIVTGANKFFCIEHDRKKLLGLRQGNNKGVKLLKMLGKSSDVKGLEFTNKDFEKNCRNGLRTYMLYFDKNYKREKLTKELESYLISGEKNNLPQVYKCSIREPWYAVPYVFSTEIAMFKRASGYNRMISNNINAYTTDTVHRISLKESVKLSSKQFCFTCLNSLTLLSMELEGRNYGGGVLELTPGEINKLSIPVFACTDEQFQAVDLYLRKNTAIETILDYTDELVLSFLGKDDRIRIRNSWRTLKSRRLNRAKSKSNR